MRWILLLLFVANVAVSVAGLFLLPDRVAVHFGAGGEPNGWGPKWQGFPIFLCMDFLFLGLFLCSHRIVFWFSPRWVNLPNKDYWLQPEHKEETSEKLTQSMLRFGIAFFLFFLVVGWLTLSANLSHPVRLEESAFLAALGAFLAYTLYWTVRFYLDFRIPAASLEEGDRP